MTQAMPKSPRSVSPPVEGTGIHYLADPHGEITAVLVPFDRWRDILSSLETLHLIKDEPMRRRLEESLRRAGGRITLEHRLVYTVT